VASPSNGAPLWTPPAGERWEPADEVPAAARGPRFVRSDAEVAAMPRPPAFPRYFRPDPETAPETEQTEAEAAEVAKAPTPMLFDSPPSAPEGPRPLTPWPDPPAAKPYPPAPIAPEPDDSWSGSWISEPETTPEPAIVPEPEVTPEPPATFAIPAEPADETPEEPVVEAEAVEIAAPEAEPAPEQALAPEPPAPFGPPVEPAVPVAPAAESSPVRTWSNAGSRPRSATASSRPHKVSFLVVSGAALVVTGIVAARRGGRH
jgi:hypothetical protein